MWKTNTDNKGAKRRQIHSKGLRNQPRSNNFSSQRLGSPARSSLPFQRGPKNKNATDSKRHSLAQYSFKPNHSRETDSIQETPRRLPIPFSSNSRIPKGDSSQATTSTKSSKSTRQTTLGEFRELAPLVDRLKSLGKSKNSDSNSQHAKSQNSSQKIFSQTKLEGYNGLAPLVKRLGTLGKPHSGYLELNNANRAKDVPKSRLVETHSGGSDVVGPNAPSTPKADVSSGTIDLLDIDNYDLESIIMEGNELMNNARDSSSLPSMTGSVMIPQSDERKVHNHSTVDMEEKKRRLLQQPDWAGLQFIHPVQMTFPEIREVEYHPAFKPKGFKRQRTNGFNRRPRNPISLSKRRYKENPMMTGALPATQSVINVKIGDDALKSTQLSYSFQPSQSPPPSGDSMLLDGLLREAQTSQSPYSMESLATNSHKSNFLATDEADIHLGAQQEHIPLGSINPFKSDPLNYLSSRYRLTDDEDLIQECQELESLPEPPNTNHVDMHNRHIFANTEPLHVNPATMRNGHNNSMSENDETSFQISDDANIDLTKTNIIFPIPEAENESSTIDSDTFKTQTPDTKDHSQTHQQSESQFNSSDNEKLDDDAAWKQFVEDDSDEFNSLPLSTRKKLQNGTQIKSLICNATVDMGLQLTPSTWPAQPAQLIGMPEGRVMGPKGEFEATQASRCSDELTMRDFHDEIRSIPYPDRDDDDLNTPEASRDQQTSHVTSPSHAKGGATTPSSDLRKWLAPQPSVGLVASHNLLGADSLREKDDGSDITSSMQPFRPPFGHARQNGDGANRSLGPPDHY